MDFTTLIRSLYSCRAFDSKTFGQEIIYRLLEVGCIIQSYVGVVNKVAWRKI